LGKEAAGAKRLRIRRKPVLEDVYRFFKRVSRPVLGIIHP
jgi:hypothetical protein